MYFTVLSISFVADVAVAGGGGVICPTGVDASGVVAVLQLPREPELQEGGGVVSAPVLTGVAQFAPGIASAGFVSEIG